MKIHDLPRSTKVVKCKTFIDKKEYTNYRESLPKHLRIIGRDKYNRLVEDYFETIGELLVDYDGGVCIDGFAYFFMFRIPNKLGYRGAFGKKKYNLHSDNYMYAFSAMFNTKYHHWTIRKKSLYKDLRAKLRENLKAGRRYMTHFHTLKTIGKL